MKEIYRSFPDQWNIIKEMDKHSRNKFRMDYSLTQLEERFKREIELDARQPRLI